MRLFLVFLIFCMNNLIYSEQNEIPFVSFQDLIKKSEHYEGQIIRTRGFVYFLQERQILSPQPNLKTCCISLYPQIYLTNSSLSFSDQALTLEGLFSKKENLLLLDRVSIIPSSLENRQTFILVTILISSLSAFWIIGFFRKRSKTGYKIQNMSET